MPDNKQEADRGQTHKDVRQITADAGAVLPALKGVKLKEVPRGHRPVPNDGKPIIGLTAEIQNLHVVATDSGATLAPIIGEFSALEIAEGAGIDLLQPFRLARFRSA